MILFEQVDLAFTILFTLELLVNITAHWFKEFVSDYWNLFDAFIILTSLLSFGPAQVSFFKTMRLTIFLHGAFLILQPISVPGSSTPHILTLSLASTPQDLIPWPRTSSTR